MGGYVPLALVDATEDSALGAAKLHTIREASNSARTAASGLSIVQMTLQGVNVPKLLSGHNMR